MRPDPDPSEAPDNRRYQAGPEAIPGLRALAAEADPQLMAVFTKAQEAKELQASRQRGLQRIREMQEQARAGQPVDLDEFAVLRAAVEAAEARMPLLTAEIETLLTEMDKVEGRLGTIMRQALTRRAIIAKGGTYPAGRA
ncbi:hypothetical protein [Roseomonas chloroacetimidivorans]|uniref:hypothetical protein n=1 Tax=Roseomonas chloroacetimidivorans TaxID=1766656 RepID=UPI003C7831BB